ncbi:hypothetical protein OEZ85_010572 [Tetradesmus obliquus]|uniref:Tyrosine-protein kinase ephrin type A/B receptor-like domain-containing protein n=1 Tax=Tetradesmus obliquus TaxID=3088 RepID=A0ABY8TMZ6_TETOB|nr:hypothetical protein OEZ85_010572 [Tetradesmus obliquus]
MSRACLITLLAFAAISCVAASRILEDDAAVTGRSLLQTADRYVCSDYCDLNQCIRVGTTGLVKCNKCKNGMKPILSGANAGQCGCPAGTYFVTTAGGNCLPCEIGSYCYKQLTWVANGAADGTGKTACSADGSLTTRARRSTSVWDCVNAGGYFLTNEATGPKGYACSGNTYAIAKSKQAACTPCPSGMVVNEAGRSSPSACKVPAGYFMKSPGQIAPCDQGSYQDKYLTVDQASVGSCKACPEGVTTKDKGSTLKADCKKLKPGYVADTIVTDEGITEAVLCPQGWYCPGDVGDDTDATAVNIDALSIDGDGKLQNAVYVSTISGATGPAGSAKIIKCEKDLWTKTVGATKVDQCLVPPGFEIVGSTIQLCAAGKYRSGWISLAAGATKTCVECGPGIGADLIEPITLYSLNTATDANTDYIVVNTVVAASSKSCFILKGQGMYYVSSGTSMVYKAKDCGVTGGVANSYGVTDKVYGLAQTPCKLCPAGTQVSATLAASDPPGYGAYLATKGFFNPLACVTKPGYGWDGRVATPCPRGWYNGGDNYKACTQCDYGLTTANPESTSIGACLSAPGFGKYDLKMMQCPAGTFNSDIKTPVACTACNDYKANTWTLEEGSDANSDCAVCAPGYGGADLDHCGVCGGAAGTYGPPDRVTTTCVECPVSVVGFQFWYNNDPYPYISPARAISTAQDASDCVAGMAQIEDGLWFLAAAEGTTATSEANIADCATACLGDTTCAVATFDYKAAAGSKCRMLKIATEASNDDIITAFKAVPSSDVSQSRKLQAAKPKAVSTGMYTQWKYDGAAIGTQTGVLFGGAAPSKAACFDECDARDNCAGVLYTNGALNTLITNAACKIITGTTDPAGTDAPKRSLTKAVPSKFAI